LSGKGDNTVAQPDKDDFNLDDFQYSGVKLPRPVEITEEVAAPFAEPMESLEAAAIASDSSSEKILPIEPKAAGPAEEQKSKAVLFKKLSEASPYLVLLGMSLVALLLAVFFLLVEWGRYDYDLHATQGKNALTMNESIISPSSGSSSILMPTTSVGMPPSELA
jgi:hypothetical protein